MPPRPCLIHMHLSGLFTLRIPKETAGEDFEGLQLLTSLLAPKGSRSAKPLVEDLSTGELTGSSVDPFAYHHCTNNLLLFKSTFQ